MLFYRFLICFLVAISSVFAQGGTEEGVWMLEQEFVKFGKKDLYESTKKEYFQDLGQFLKKKGNFARYAMQDLDSSQYLYWIPFSSYDALEVFFRQQRNFQASLKTDEGAQKRLVRASTMSFSISGLQVYLPTCSSVLKGKESFFSLPNVVLYEIGLTPGQESVFEKHLEQLVTRQSASESPSCWRVWRVSLGYDLPKYYIAIFGESEKEVEKRSEALELISPSMKNIVRKEKKTVAVMRSDLSFF